MFTSIKGFIKRWADELKILVFFILIFGTVGFVVYEGVVNHSEVYKRGVVVGYNYDRQYTIIEVDGHRYNGLQHSGIIGYLGDSVSILTRIRDGE